MLTVPELFPAATPWLPQWLLQVNLLIAWIFYITLVFLAGIAVRLRFYLGIFRVAKTVATDCPSIYALISDHWFLLLGRGVIRLIFVYSLVLIPYLAIRFLLFPEETVSLAIIAEHGPVPTALLLLAAACMITVDVALTVSAAVIDEERVSRDLRWAEGWLGGRVNRTLDWLIGAERNPIRSIARQQVEENMAYLNAAFRVSMHWMIVQMVLRLVVAAGLFSFLIW